ncbi:MAG: hypothetical protein ACXVEF_36625 [Polyangiales bacterium]
MSSLLLAWPALSQAETGVPYDACASGSDAVVPSSVPANLPGLAITGGVEVTDVSLLAPDGTEVPTTVTGTLYEKIVKIDGTLVEGDTYTIRWSDTCEGMQTKSFTATASVPLPSSAGIASAGELKNDLYYGMCDESGDPILQAQRYVNWTPAPELIPFLPVLRVQLVVDGAPSYFYGHTWGSWNDTKPAGGFFLACPNIPLTRAAKVIAELPGGPTLSTPAAMVTISCPDAPPTPCGEPASPDPDAGASSSPDASTADAANAAPPSASATGSGCAIGGSGRSLGAITLFGIAAVLFAQRRRRVE